MKLLTVIPRTILPLAAPPTFTYFFPHALPAGSFVFVPVQRRMVPGLVLKVEELAREREALRRARFQLKPAGKVITAEPLLRPWQIQLMLWLAEYYAVSPALALKTVVPEFALKIRPVAAHDVPPQTLHLFPEHSGETTKSRQLWEKTQSGELSEIIGTRSAVFAPFANLKRIIIEEEENSAYKSWDASPRYDARTVARKLAELWGATIEVRSETPRAETWLTVKSKFQSVNSKTAELTAPRIVDMREELKKGNYSPISDTLSEALRKTLTAKKQAFLFFNRKGVSTALICRDCGYVHSCPECSANLILHKNVRLGNAGKTSEALICHHCAHVEEPPLVCPKCRSPRLKYFGSGVEKIVAELERRFPEARVAQLDAEVGREKEIRTFVEFQNKKIDILVGTQFALKSLLPPVALAAAVAVDPMLFFPDVYSSERVFQILWRLRRIALETFLIQTYNPDLPLFLHLAEESPASFYREELEVRKALGYPPFRRITRLTVAHRDPRRASEEAKQAASELRFQVSRAKLPIEILGPAPAFVAKEKGLYRWNILLKEGRSLDLARRNDLLAMLGKGWIIDVEPIETL